MQADVEVFWVYNLHSAVSNACLCSTFELTWIFFYFIWLNWLWRYYFPFPSFAFTSLCMCTFIYNTSGYIWLNAPLLSKKLPIFIYRINTMVLKAMCIMDLMTNTNGEIIKLPSYVSDSPSLDVYVHINIFYNSEETDISLRRCQYFWIPFSNYLLIKG